MCENIFKVNLHIIVFKPIFTFMNVKRSKYIKTYDQSAKFTSSLHYILLLKISGKEFLVIESRQDQRLTLICLCILKRIS